MRGKSFIIGLAVIAVLVSAVFSYSKDKKDPRPITEINISKMQIVSIDEFVRQPNRYKGVVAVSGTVKKSIPSKSSFILGCADDWDAMMPVEYKKQLPKPQTKITVIGELAKTKEGKYVFKATDIKNEE